MAQLSPAQRAWRRRIETALHVAAPALDLLLSAGDRLSRAVERDDLDWVPPRRSLTGAAPYPGETGDEPYRHA
jgi:hypothetical protein